MDVKNNKKNLTVRIFSLVLLIVLANSWLVTNSGRELKQFAIVYISLLFLAVTGSIIKYLSENEQKDVMAYLRSVLLFVLNTSVIISLWSVFIILCLFTSSVTLQTRKNSSSCNAKLFRVNTGSRLSNKPPIIISGYLKPKPVLINPFGQTFTMDMEGYQSYTFEVFPLVPKRIIVENDMISSPSVFVRMSEDVQTYKNVYKLCVSFHGRKIHEAVIGEKGGFLFGINQKLPNEFLERWQLELRSRDDIIEDSEYYKQLKSWCIDTLFIDADLYPMDTLNIKIINSADSVVKELNYKIGFDIIQDLLVK